jgi:hypothetical protein
MMVRSFFYLMILRSFFYLNDGASLELGLLMCCQSSLPRAIQQPRIGEIGTNCGCKHEDSSVGESG